MQLLHVARAYYLLMFHLVLVLLTQVALNPKIVCKKREQLDRNNISKQLFADGSFFYHSDLMKQMSAGHEGGDVCKSY